MQDKRKSPSSNHSMMTQINDIEQPQLKPQELPQYISEETSNDLPFCAENSSSLGQGSFFKHEECADNHNVFIVDGHDSPQRSSWPLKYYTLLFVALSVSYAAGVGTGSVINTNHTTPSPIVNAVDVAILPWESSDPASVALSTMDDLEALKRDILLANLDLQKSTLNSTDQEERTQDTWASERYVVENESTTSEMNQVRNLQARPAMFKTLTCNANISSSVCTTTLSSLLSATAAGSAVTVPCGICVTVDQQAGEYLTLGSGLRVEGKLYFPPSASVTIRTTFVLVLGVLKMDIPASGKVVKISLYGENDLFFTPTADNAAACSATGCKIGKKVIAVAGGRLDINGYASQCPTWEKLQDVGRSGQAIANPSTCVGNIVINGNADTGTVSGWSGWGNPIDVEDGALRAYSRPSSLQAMFQSLPTACIAVGQTWRVSAKVKIYNETTRTPLDCRPGFTGTYYDCPLARLQAIRDGNVQSWKDYRDRDMIWNKDGAWSYFKTDILITPELSGSQTIRLHLAGGPLGSAILFDDVVFEPINAVDQLRVTAAAATCWTAGTELVITSHTRWNFDEQVVKVATSDPTTGLVTLTKAIIKPMTLFDSPDFAVEVAALSRPIIFEADSSPTDALIGGHLIIMNTPGVAQRLEGVAVHNFGQQGTLGRYPVHFHLCENVPGSTVKRNVVRNSNQRCYVIHGSHQVTVEDNVAYNTSGHCYFLEDGSEQNNTFTHNIGIKVSNAVKSLSDLSLRTETDTTTSSVFWISNPLNDFSRNIAAGSDNFGFFFETHSSVRGSSAYQKPGLIPANENLGLFRDNEAHSCANTGFTTYPPGWTPTLEARIDNLKVYRNAGRGLFLHVTRNLRFTNGIVADNGSEGVFINRGDNITFNGTKIIGLTERADRSHLCQYGKFIRGLVIHPTKLQEFDNTGTIVGLTLINVEIVRWTPENTGCDNRTVAVTIGESQSLTPLWNAPTSFTKVKIEGAFDACTATTIFVNDSVIEVTDGSLNGTRGFLVQSGMKTFAGTCIPFGKCIDFCTGSCLRTVRFLTNAASDAVSMIVSATTATGRVNGTYIGRLRGETTGYAESGFPLFDKQFAVSLPSGSYQITFVNVSGTVVFPEYVIPVFEKAPSCTGYVSESNIVIVKPAITPERCSALIENGRFDNGLSFWQSISGAPQVVNGVFKTTTRTDPVQHMVSQWLDTSCLQVGNRYDLRLEYRLVDAAGVNVVACDAGGSYCPKASLAIGVYNATTGMVVETWVEIGKSDGPYKMGASFNSISGSWIVTDAQVAAQKIRFNIFNGNGQFMIDNVSFTKVDRCAGSRIVNGNAVGNNANGWSGWSNPIGAEAPGADGTGYALKAYNRTTGWVQGLSQSLDTVCINPGEIYSVDFKVKMYNAVTRASIGCNPRNDPTYTSCPVLRLRSQNTSGYTYVVVQDPKMVWNATSWNQFRVNVTISTTMAGPGVTQFLAVLCGGPVNSVLLIDDFTFQKVV